MRSSVACASCAALRSFQTHWMIAAKINRYPMVGALELSSSKLWFRAMATGINLSAFYATRKPLIAQAKMVKGEARVTIRPFEAFSERLRLSDRLSDVEVTWRQEWLGLEHPVAVDVALDFEPTPDPDFAWQLEMRPEDFAFYLDAPDTDAFGRRFRKFAKTLDDAVIEASPRATVEVLDFRGQYRDGAVHIGHSGWRADNRNKRSDKLLCKLLTELGVNPHDKNSERLNSDDFDVTLCALTALAVEVEAPLLFGPNLNKEVQKRCARRGNVGVDDLGDLPMNSNLHVLVQPFWDSVSVTKIGS